MKYTMEVALHAPVLSIVQNQDRITTAHKVHSEGSTARPMPLISFEHCAQSGWDNNSE